MIIQDQQIILKNSKTAKIRSAKIEDSFEIVEVRKCFYEESSYLLLEPEEYKGNIVAQSNSIERMTTDPEEMMLVATIDEHIVAVLTLNHVRKTNKTRHRAELGISVLKEYWHLGIATMMIEIMKQYLSSTSYKQIELSVFANNTNAIGLYQKCGFKSYGILPGAFKVNEEYINEVLMVLDWSSRQESNPR